MALVFPARSLSLALGLALVVLVGNFFYRLLEVRRRVQSFHKNHGLKSPPHSFLFGNIPAMAKLMAKYPRDVAGHTVPTLLIQEYPELRQQGLVCMDAWPFANPMLSVFHPDMMAQFCQEPSMPKDSLMGYIFQDFTASLDLVSSNGAHWKKWRSIFNPGFSNKNILSLVPAFIDDVQVFKETLFRLADSDNTIQLIDPATRATCDIIGRVVVGAKLGIQTSENRMYKTLKSQLKWISIPEGPQVFHRRNNPFRQLIVWNNNRILRNEIIPHLRRQIREIGEARHPRTINSLAIEGYLEQKAGNIDEAPEHLLFDQDFLRNAIAHIEMFIIAGHDTTASTLCYAYYCLNRNRDAADRIRKEHRDVLGPDTSAYSAVIASDPSVLHRLPYTTAVIKETLRLYPAISSIRSGSHSLQLVHPETHQRFETEGFTLLSATQAVHRLPECWEKPNNFLPERWLAKEGDALYPRKNAWRPFELGPRNCIGQDLAMMELRLILIFTLGDLDIVPAYGKDAQQLFGEPAYQADVPNEFTNHPKNGMPVRIRRRVS